MKWNAKKPPPEFELWSPILFPTTITITLNTSLYVFFFVQFSVLFWSVKTMTPYEVWKGYKPNVNHLHIFGCCAYAHIPKDERSKMDPKVKKSIFLEYGIGVNGYRLFDTDTPKVFHSRDVIFNEIASISEQGTEEVENQPLVEVECENINSDDDENSQEAIEPRRSPRIRKAPDQYGEWVYMAHRLNDTLLSIFPLSSCLSLNIFPFNISI